MTETWSRTRLAVLALVGAAALVGCGGSDDAGGTGQQAAADAGRLVFVEASGPQCQLSKRGAPPGEVTFTVRNSGERAVGVTVLAEDDSELGSVAVAGGQLFDLVVPMSVGDFTVRCEPDGADQATSTDFVVSEGDPAGGF